MKQLSFAVTQVGHSKDFVITRKNEALMKQCYRDVYKMGMVSDETMRKVSSTNYVRGEICLQNYTKHQ